MQYKVGCGAAAAAAAAAAGSRTSLGGGKSLWEVQMLCKYSIELVSYTVLFYRAATVFFIFFFFFELSPGPWLLQILVVGPGPGNLMIMSLRRY